MALLEKVQKALAYVMPQIEGETLRQRLNREKQLPLDEALEIARHVAHGGTGHRGGMRNDGDLASLHGNPRFEAMIRDNQVPDAARLLSAPRRRHIP